MENTTKKKDCMFCDIIERNLPSILVNEEDFVILEDIKPDAKKHLLCIPKAHFENIYDAQPENFETIKNMMEYVKNNADELGVPDGCRITINNGAKAAQTMFHCHMHVLGGQQLKHTERQF